MCVRVCFYNAEAKRSRPRRQVPDASLLVVPSRLEFQSLHRHPRPQGSSERSQESHRADVLLAERRPRPRAQRPRRKTALCVGVASTLSEYVNSIHCGLVLL